MTEVKTVKVSDKGQIAIPVDIREAIGIKKGDTLLLIKDKKSILLKKADELTKETKNEFEHLLKNSEQVAKKFWGSKADDVWDTI